MLDDTLASYGSDGIENVFWEESRKGREYFLLLKTYSGRSRQCSKCTLRGARVQLLVQARERIQQDVAVSSIVTRYAQS